MSDELGKKQGLEWLNPTDAAVLLGFSRAYLVAMAKAGDFGPDSVSETSGSLMISKQSLLAWLESHPRPNPEEIGEVEWETEPVRSLAPEEERRLRREIEQRRFQSNQSRPRRKGDKE